MIHLTKNPKPGQCEAQVSDHNSRWPSYYQCSSKPKVEREGHHYCLRHDPVKVAAEEKERSVKREAEWEARRAGWDRDAKAKKTLEMVESILGTDFTEESLKTVLLRRETE